ncbi:H-type lectin domain-containing protein [Aestuariibius sp. 2305UL40-4]|uniref:H-type lectin domain-containing protein n=1 Tax=Aestuariibius violaceus TaxID=3234132 RepID=UPI00345E85D1
MKQLFSPVIGVDQGEVVLFSDFANGGEMWAGEGPRSVQSEVAFSQPFREPPVVQANLSMWDIAGGKNARIDLSAVNVTRDGFTLLLKTWEDTKIARVRAGWIAIGSLFDEDGWDV